jgi:hypothetical protein
MCERNTFAYLWLNKELIPIDLCISSFILQLRSAGIKTIASCCGHGIGYPWVLCAKGSEDKLSKFGCQIIIPRYGDGLVMAYFPGASFTGKVYPVKSIFHSKDKEDKA